MPTLSRRTLVLAAAPVFAAACFATAHWTSAAAARASDPGAGPVTSARSHAGSATPSVPATHSAAAAGRQANAAASASRPAPAVQPVAPLAANQLPNDAKASWKPLGAPMSRPAGHLIGLNECAGMTGATGWVQQGWASAQNTPAIQDSFSFSTAADAARALAQAESGMQSCQTPLRALQAQHGLPADATVARTATGTDASAWQYQWNAVSGMSASGRQSHHVYLVQYGNQLTVLQYADLASAGQADSATPAGDQNVLATLATHLRTTR